ncbi:calcium-binding protein [Sphingomonas sabuli]|uniref:Calcium-binding protein n=1 Tax=Sphingomonas sabuli TaxID=2764186 RepID=A0A7G9KZQ3_9SPHN|nr:calcium-binding protein [Sphingomonas sabuli]QNM81852.1 calcium-binding protein [Sphingomonas sabuli]
MRGFANTGTTWNDLITGGTLVGANSSVFTVETAGDVSREYFWGSGLGATSQNMPTAGTITSWEHEVYGGEPGVFIPGWEITEFSVSAATFSSLILNDNLDTLFADYIMTGDDSVLSGYGNDVLLGYGGNDMLQSAEGNDILDGGTGDDLMYGGFGDDTYFVDSVEDDVVEYADQGIDTLILTVVPPGGFIRTPDHFEILRNNSGVGIAMLGNELSNSLFGSNSGSDILFGEEGNDVLSGGSGPDVLHGGAGDDVFFVDDAGDIVDDKMLSGDVGSGTDEVRSSIAFSLLSSDGLADIENLRLIGTASVDATGNRLNNELTGNSGDNILNGSAGADIMRGNSGNDIYYVDNGGDRVIESSAAGGTDTVRSSTSFELGDHVENLQLTGSAVSVGTGNGLANRISGNNQANILSGLEGDDVLTGNGGTDLLYGAAGIDQIDGGSGDDFLDGGAGRDLITGGAGADSFVFNAGDFAGLSTGTCDRILDFARAEGDQIRLNSIDANSANGAASNDAFTFIGTGGFTGVAGQLRYQQAGGNTYITGDVDGDGIADFMIRLDGMHALVAGDFVL